VNKFQSPTGRPQSNSLIKYVLRCLSIEDDNRFIFLTEIKNVGKPEIDIDAVPEMRASLWLARNLYLQKKS
jgi:hypothetical protein